MSTEANVGVFEDRADAERTVRWLRRSALHARIEQVGAGFEVVVPSSEMQQAESVLQAVASTRERLEPTELAGWGRVRSGVFNVENLGTLFAVVVAVILLLAIGLWIWSLVGPLGWLGMILVIVAGLVFFQFSGIPHSAVKNPRRYSHKHDVTMVEEQEVQYRLAWAREDYAKFRQRRSRRKRSEK